MRLLNEIIRLVAIVLFWGLITCFQAAAWTHGNTGVIFNELKIGAGGFSTRLTIANDGTKYTGIDVYGAYYLNPNVTNCSASSPKGCWQQIVNTTSIPANLQQFLFGQGVYEIAAAPTNGAHVYIIYQGYLLYSTNHGGTFTQSSCAQLPNAAPNGFGTRTFGRFMAVDPNNENIVIWGSPSNGAFKSADGGATCSALAVPPSIGTTVAATSSTSQTIGTGSKTFTVNSCSNIFANEVFQVYETSNTFNQEQGSVTSCVGTTLVINITTTFGSGTHGDWSIFAADINNQSAGQELVAFDPTSAVVGGATQGIYISAYGAGVYHSTDGASTFALTSGSPTSHKKLVVDPLGNVWLTDNTSSGSLSNLWELKSGTWSNFNFGGGNSNNLLTIAPDPSNCAANSTCHIIVATTGNGGQVFTATTNGGSTWSGLNFGEASISSSDIPWIANSNEVSFMSNGDQQFDNNGLLWFAEGVGVFTTTPPYNGTAYTWTSVSAGIEDLVAMWAISLPSGNPIFVAQDRQFWTISNPNAYQSGYGTNTTNAVSNGYSADYASTSTGTIVGLANEFSQNLSGFSLDGGATWSAFGAIPAEAASFAGGSIAAAGTNTFAWVDSNGSGNLYCTTNGQAGTPTWTKQSINGIPSGDGWGGFTQFLRRQTLISDGANADTFYVYNDGTTAPGVYETTDGCTSWTQIMSGHFDADDGDNATMRKVPGVAGEFFYTSGEVGSGNQSHPANNQFYDCVVGNSPLCTTVANVLEVETFGFGHAAPGKTFPAVYIYGWVNNVGGIWESDDHCVTWRQLSGLYPNGSLDVVVSLMGDMNTYGLFYVGFQGSGWIYGHR